MNRSERRKMEKKLGLHEFYKKMTRQKRLEMIQERQNTGKRMENEMKEKVLISIKEQEDKKESDIISSNAEFISKNKNIPLIDAMVIAKEQYFKSSQNKK